MKNLKDIILEHFENSKFSIIERLHITKNTGNPEYNYHPKYKDEFFELVDKLIDERGWDADLNDIDTSQITDMSGLFEYMKFNGNISKWNVSNVKNMHDMFYYCAFTGENGDISDWNVSNVEDMHNMFAESAFMGNISDWDVSKVEDMSAMFYSCKGFNCNLDDWNVSNVKDKSDIFYECPLEKNPPKWYK